MYTRKKVSYKPTTVVGYLRPVTNVKLIAKVAIKELTLNSGSNSVALRAPPAPPKQSVNFMAELGDILKSGVQLKSVKQRRLNLRKTRVPDDVASFINNF